MMKLSKILAMLLSVAMLFSLLVSCGDEPEKPAGDQPSDSGEQNGGDNTEKPDGDGDGTGEEEKPAFVPLQLKNELMIPDVTQRLFYPDTVKLLAGLETVKANIGGVFADAEVLRGYLTRLYADAQGLGVYADYIGHTFLQSGDTVFGAAPDEYAFGGGKGYPAAASKAKYTATTGDELKAALELAKSGDTILIAGETSIDMSDWILGGEVNGFTQESGKIKYEMVIPAGVTLMGERGSGIKGGTIIKVSSYTDIAVRLKAGARLSGLVIQGPDTPYNQDIPSTNHSVGILIDGDGARIDNCEISGFSRQAIVVKGCKDAEIDHNYIHHLQGDSGVAVFVSNATATIENNLLSQVNTVCSIFGETTDVTAKNNVLVSTSEKAFFNIGSSKTYDADYKKARVGCQNLTVRNNTFLASGQLLTAAGLPVTLSVENNLFAYGVSVYTDTLATVNSVDESIYELDRIAIQNNAFDMIAPKVYSKASAGDRDEKIALQAFVPEEKAAKKAEVTTARLTVLGSNYYPNKDDNPYMVLRGILDGGDSSLVSSMKKNVNAIMTDIGGYTNYLTYFDREDGISTVSGGKTYGAVADEKGQIGGGAGYYKIFTEKDADYVCTSAGQLASTVAIAKDGAVIYIPENARIDLSDVGNNTIKTLEIKSKITLCSNRGYVHEDGSVSTGGVITVTALGKEMLIQVFADGTRISGLTFYGPDPATHESHHYHAFSAGFFPPCQKNQPGDLDHLYYYNLQVVSGIAVNANDVEIDNCEISGFTSCAITLNTAQGVASRGTRIHHNYIHHNQMKGLGYGVSHGHAYSTIYNNLFNYNRHSIAGSGHADSGYTAYNNVEMGNALSANFDMHGGSDRTDGTQVAGEYTYIYNNTFLGTQPPYNVRGVATKDRSFEYNIVFNSRESFGNTLLVNRYTNELLENIKLGQNLWGVKTDSPKFQKG